ncbi:MAG TPA: methyltransferase domain-containing protein, partial [Vicinamibacterales bacterium]|nr:methyltransferase domain-containing protein [Vicinamibacterales bacterium]
MDVSLLDLLRCPFCGTRLDLVSNDALAREGSQINFGVLGCQCCAFPIVDGIPVLIADDVTRSAIHALEAGRRDDARAALLGLDAAGAGRLRAVLADGTATYRLALEIISRDAEATYFVYHFSDPNYVLAETLVRVLGRERTRTARVLDLCGGSGHLTRVLGQVSDQPVVVADIYYWKLWLAQRFTSPGCAPVCCDANAPMPFVDDSFSTVVLFDAFPYIWHKRLLAGEMLRLAGPAGTILMPHLHSSLAFNHSAGMTLTPAAYRDLFAHGEPRLFRDSDLMNDILGHTAIDLSRDVTPEQAGDEPTVTLM